MKAADTLPSLAVRFTGDRSRLEAAEGLLLAAVPSGTLVRKAQGLFVVNCSAVVAATLKLPKDWLLYEPTYADLHPPGLNLRGLQLRLAQHRCEDSDPNLH